MASHFNDDPRDRPMVSPVPPRAEAAEHLSEPAGVATAEPSTPLVSEAVIKFRSCRWRRPPDEGTECCGHRDVLPMAGTTSFDPEAWCPECTFFKLRRSPKKRSYY